MKNFLMKRVNVCVFAFILISSALFSACGRDNNEEASVVYSELKADTSAEQDVVTSNIGDEKLANEELSKGIINISIDHVDQSVEWEDNESVEALENLIDEKGSMTIQMRMYGDFEQVGSLGADITSDDVQMTTGPGDIVLYNGNQIVIFYGSNTWAYTKLGKLKASQEELESMLANGDVEVFLSLSE
ncbi:cyclophilin-like fold protein [Pseudobutyrivibrio ruminis]|uniref:Cyclophilin-like domain-containing protein n=1 Tax=Pseudobutyrivibrio ruminis TaxID=46206 RepID=A0A2G3DT98_9FIRM|nr:cyclophilin-like fold protein [Pseudobutyrivibrio ruminis]PHU34267.1 hypothetical protein CSX01_10940 [Pseudobutyrivibrio ruminis]